MMSFKALTRYLVYKYFFEHEEEEDVFKRILSEEDRRKRDRRIPRMSIRRYGDSPFKFLFGACSADYVQQLLGAIVTSKGFATSTNISRPWFCFAIGAIPTIISVIGGIF